MPLEPFDYHPSTRMVFGPGSIQRLGELSLENGAKKVLLVTDPGIVRAGHVSKALKALDGSGLEAVVFAGVEENPTTHIVDAGLKAAKGERIDFLIGLGGGSAMDSAKGINFLYSFGGEMKDYWGVGKAPGPMLPMVAVPTTAGTGSESQSFALISDPVTHQKMACGDKKAACRAAILDPELTLTQPRPVTAATGIDALSHAVETFVTRRRNPFSRMLSREAWKLLSGSFGRVLEAPDDVESRGHMLLGASLAGAAIENSMLGAAHSAANPLTAHFGVVHGHAIGILLPHVVRFNSEVADVDYLELLEFGGFRKSSRERSGDALARLLEELYSRTGLPARLRDYGVEEGSLEDLALEAEKQWTATFNPRPASRSDFVEIYRCAL